MPRGRAEALHGAQKAAWDKTAAILRRCSVDTISLETGAPYMTAFLQFFKDRARRFR
jgi:hypothetical protein